MNPHRVTRLAAIAAFASVTVVLVAWVIHYGPTWLSRDSVGYLYYLNEAESGNLTFKEMLLARNNEHLVAFQYAFALGSLKIFSMHFRALIFESVAFLVLTGVLIYATLRHSRIANQFAILLPFAIVIPLLNPSQASYLLWEFQTWLYYDFAFLAANILLIEKYRFRAYPAVFLMCILASGSEAQGSFLWLAAGAHLFWVSVFDRKPVTRIAGTLVLAVHLIIFLGLAWLLMHGEYVSSAATSLVHQAAPEKLSAHVAYFVAIMGGGFGIRNETTALIFGAVSMLLWCVFTAIGVRQKFAAVELRVAFLLTGIPLLWTLAFAVAREPLGLTWAFGEFHASPMLIPFFMGLAVYALYIEASYRSTVTRWLCCLTIAFAMLPTVTGIPVAREQSILLKVTSTMAVALECNPTGASLYLRLHLEGLEGAQQAYALVDRFRARMCAAQANTSEGLPLVTPPAQFVELMKGDAHTKAAISALWDIYLSNTQLRLAFKRSEPNLANELLAFAARDARSGSPYEPSLLGPFADVYLRLWTKP
ncbi:MAG: hypothetical protein WCA85_16640 [Paraburkholderia sp.]|uniref:hypothetical protein n=1 Tax=Paraburkholderia sp. TaxID=1926495 RepID=UPI003C42A287